MADAEAGARAIAKAVATMVTEIGPQPVQGATVGAGQLHPAAAVVAVIRAGAVAGRTVGANDTLE